MDIHLLLLRCYPLTIRQSVSMQKQSSLWHRRNLCRSEVFFAWRNMRKCILYRKGETADVFFFFKFWVSDANFSPNLWVWIVKWFEVTSAKFIWRGALTLSNVNLSTLRVLYNLLQRKVLFVENIKNFIWLSVATNSFHLSDGTSLIPSIALTYHVSNYIVIWLDTILWWP